LHLKVNGLTIFSQVVELEQDEMLGSNFVKLAFIQNRRVSCVSLCFKLFQPAYVLQLLAQFSQRHGSLISCSRVCEVGRSQVVELDVELLF